MLIDFVSTSDDTDRAVRGDIIRTLNSLHKEFEERLVIISVSDETEDRVRSKKEPPIEYSSAIDTKKRTATALGVDDMPSVLIIDPQGIVRWQGFWLLDGTDAAIEAARKLLEQVPGL